MASTAKAKIRLGSDGHRSLVARLGLEQYEQAFRDNDIDDEVLQDLTADDLISIGVTSVGHRRKLLAAIGPIGCLPGTTRDSKNFWSCNIPARGAGFLRAGKHGMVRAARP